MALHSQGTFILHGDGDSPEGFTEIEEVNGITGPDGTAQLIEVTHLQSAGKEYLSGLPDFGKVSLTCNFTGGTEQMKLRTMFSTHAPAENFIIAVPDEPVANPAVYHQFAFSAAVNGWSISTPTDDKAQLTISLQTSGAMVYTKAQLPA